MLYTAWFVHVSFLTLELNQIGASVESTLKDKENLLLAI
jgi:hypothetical protein